MSEYVDVTDIAKQVRANIKQAQGDGAIDPDVKVRVRTGRASMCLEVNVFIQGDKEERRTHGCWTPAALELAKQVRACMGPAEEWKNGQSRFSCLYFRDGLCAP